MEWYLLNGKVCHGLLGQTFQVLSLEYSVVSVHALWKILFLLPWDNSLIAEMHLFCWLTSPECLCLDTHCLCKLSSLRVLKPNMSFPRCSFLGLAGSELGTEPVLDTEPGPCWPHSPAVLGDQDAHRISNPFPQENALISIRILKFAPLKYMII